MDFLYSAKNQDGELVQGRIDAPSEDRAVATLHQRNLIVLSLEQAEKNIFSKDIFASSLNRPSRKDIVLFTRQLATVVEADVPLVQGLYTLVRQVEKESFKEIISNVAASIEGGTSLSEALAEHKKVFGSFYISLVRAGEVAGKLQNSLNYLADYLERSASLNSKIKGAMAYPAFILSALVVVTMILVTTVLPQLLTIIKDAGVEDIPITTKILMSLTDIVNRFIVLIIIAVAAAIFSVVYYIRTPAGKKKLDGFLITMPQFGTISRSLYLARIAETLSTLIKAGVPILDGISISSDIVGNEIYREILLEARDNVKGGGTMSEVFDRYKEFPPLVSSMLAIGEKTGRTEFMLDNIFKFYKAEAENKVQNISQLIEPILILALGLGVGILVSAVLLPIYSLVGAA